MAVKLIHHNANNVMHMDEPSMPWKLEAVLAPPEFMKLAFSVMFGNEQIIIRGDTEEELKETADRYGITHCQRLISLRIYRPETE